MQALPRCCWQHRLQPEARVRREAESERGATRPSTPRLDPSSYRSLPLPSEPSSAIDPNISDLPICPGGGNL